MKEGIKQREAYMVPKMEIIEFRTEQGYAVSTGMYINMGSGHL